MVRWPFRLLAALIACTCASLVLLALLRSPLDRLPSSRLISSSSSPSATAAESGRAPERRMGGGKDPPVVVAVVGSGLAGLSAAYEASRVLAAELPEARVVVLEKNGMLGGNSMKASSGINAVNPPAGDSLEAFAADTTKSGGGLSKPELIDQLVGGSEGGLALLQALGLDLSSVVRLGGHSVPRTRSNPSGPNVGTYLVKAVAAAVQEAANVDILKGAKVVSVERSPEGGLLRVEYEEGEGGQAAARALEARALVLATGGFGASRELLRRYSPEVAELPTTNGDWAQGEGVQLGERLGAALLHMDQVQVHPTGFVDPADPSAGTKWLAPEKLRGVGAVLLNAAGARFCDELSTRDKVSAALQAQEGRVAWLVLGAAGAALFGEGTLGFYGSKQMVVKLGGVGAAAQHMGLAEEGLRSALSEYNAAAEAGSDAFGKKYFPTAFDLEGPLWVGRVTPVVHYCMGGVEIDAQAQVLSKQGSPIPGVFAAGEVSGGLHGANRLGGNSLAECVVFGRIAGQQAAAHVLPRTVVHHGGGGVVVDMMNAAQSVAASAL